MICWPYFHDLNKFCKLLLSITIFRELQKNIKGLKTWFCQRMYRLVGSLGMICGKTGNVLQEDINTVVKEGA